MAWAADAFTIKKNKDGLREAENVYLFILLVMRY